MAKSEDTLAAANSMQNCCQDFSSAPKWIKKCTLSGWQQRTDKLVEVRQSSLGKKHL
jgi:hypothetical protein